MQSTSNKKYLNEVIIVRLGLIVLLVFFHAFAIYGGAWHRNYTPPSVNLYYWLDWLSFSFMLETFVFLSGFLFGAQIRNKGLLPIQTVIGKKFKRLIIPSIIFSVIYYFCFMYKHEGISIGVIVEWIGGVAHMWFLPMLFWCFLITRIILQFTEKHYKLVVFISVIASILSFLPLPFQIDKCLYYIPFFIVGLFWGKGEIRSISPSNKIMVLTCALFLVFFVFFTKQNSFLLSVIDNYSISMKLVIYSLVNVGKIVYSGLGVLLVYMIMCKVKEKGIEVSPSLIKLSECCFGVYLIQQFVLVYLYDFTTLPINVHFLILPWTCFFIALLVSLLFSWALRQTTIGRYLI